MSIMKKALTYLKWLIQLELFGTIDTERTPKKQELKPGIDLGQEQRSLSSGSRSERPGHGFLEGAERCIRHLLQRRKNRRLKRPGDLAVI